MNNLKDNKGDKTIPEQIEEAKTTDELYRIKQIVTGDRFHERNVSIWKMLHDLEKQIDRKILSLN